MKKNVVRLNESQLRQIVKESVKRVLREYNVDDFYRSEIGNRSQYAPDDADAVYAYNQPGELSMAAQGEFDHMTGDDRPRRWAQGKQFRSLKESEEEENNPWQELEKAKRSGDTKRVLAALKKIENMLRSSGELQDADATIYGRKVRTSTNNPNGECLWQSDEEYDDIDA